MRRIAFTIALSLTASTLGAQTAPASLMEVADTASVRPRSAAWLSVTLGPARTDQSDQNLFGGQIALWGARDRMVAAIRRSGGSDLDTRDEYDTAVLFGARTTPGPFMAMGAIGPTVVTGAPAAGPRSSATGVGVAGEISLNLRFVGVGVSGFGALASGHRFAGLGVTAELGVIR